MIPKQQIQIMTYSKLNKFKILKQKNKNLSKKEKELWDI